MANLVVDTYLVYQFLKRLTTPFNQTEAFKLGIIDAKGRVLKKKSQLTTDEEADAWGYFDILVNNMKKILAKVPGGSSKMGLYAASALLFKEHNNLVGKTDYEMMKLFEETLANTVGSGKIAGLGVGDQGEPPMHKAALIKRKLKRKMLEK
jgi:hypothetical protein